MNGPELAQRALLLIPMVLSLTVHEWAHAWSAFKLGDDTAARLGRLTLNPIAHIDPIGTLLLPLLGIPFGWAKPVPVNPARFRRDVTMRTGMAITAAAGPISNVVIAVLCAVALGLALRWAPGSMNHLTGAGALLSYGIQLNVALAIFNLLPIPPLDGSRIVERFVPAGMQDAWDSLKRVAPLLLMGLMVFGGTRFLARPMGTVTGALWAFVLRLADG